ncbi:MAG: hypothetical protein FJ222_11340 [Lentisphaerae bacterium]|nr:hypothetical protein [Lentisphaerota bacterium]
MHKNSCVAHVCLTLCLAAWVIHSDETWFWTGLLWLSLMGLALGLLFPFARKDESSEDARVRVCRNLARDPVVAAGLAATLFFVVQAANGGRALIYDPSTGQWTFSLPFWRWGPSSVVAADAWRASTLACVFTCVCAMLRHAVGKPGKILLLQAMGLNAAVLSLWMLVRLALQNGFGLYGLPQFLFAAQPETVGAFYLLMVAISCGLAITALIAKRPGGWMMLVVFLNFAGVCLSNNPQAILAAWVFVGASGLYIVKLTFPLLLTGQIAKIWSYGVIPFVLAGFVYFGHFPQNPVLRAVRAAGSWGTWLFGGASASSEAVAAAWRMVGDHPWVGVGAGGFKPFAPIYGLVESLRDDGHVGQDGVEYLCEHGLLGCGLVALAVGWIVVENMRRLALVPQVRSESDAMPDRVWLFRLTPMAVVLSLGVAMVFVLSFSGPVFRSPFVSLSWCAAVTCLGSFLPMRRVIEYNQALISQDQRLPASQAG